MTIYLLYIDPGTGSALFSILIGAAATFYFLGRALLLKLKVILSGGRVIPPTGAPNSYIVYNEGKQYSNVFKPVLEEFESRGINLLYLTSSSDDPLLCNPYKYIKGEYIGEGNKAFSRLNMINADVVLMTTPGLDVYQLKRSKGVKHYSHILHYPSDATLYRLFGLDYFDSILLTGDHQADDIRVLEKQRGIKPKQLIVTGCTYLDVFMEKIKLMPKEEHHLFTVLVSPSWGNSGILSRFGDKLLDPLIETGFRIIVRPHPQSAISEKSTLDGLYRKYKEVSNLVWDYESENITSLSKADIMISDFSGIIFDYAFLFHKPVIYIKQGFDPRPYDADDLGEGAIENLWHFRTAEEIGKELREDEFSHIGEIIQSMSDNIEKRQARLRAKNIAWKYPGEAGKRIVDYLTNLVK